MANLTRYAINQIVRNKFPENVMIGFDAGEWVKFDDVKEFLPSASTNSASTPCPLCKKGKIIQKTFDICDNDECPGYVQWSQRT